MFTVSKNVFRIKVSDRKFLIFYHLSQFFTSRFLFIELCFLKKLNYFDLWIALTGLLFKPFPGRNKAPTILYILTHFIDWAIPARPKACNDISCFIISTSDKTQIIISKLLFVGLIPYLCPVLRRGVIFVTFFQEQVNLSKDKYGTYDATRNFVYRDSDSLKELLPRRRRWSSSNTRRCQTPRAHMPQNKRTIFYVSYVWRNLNSLSSFTCSYKLRNFAGLHLCAYFSK